MSQQINLFNPVFLKQHTHFSLLTMLQALSMIVAGALLFYGYAFYQVRLVEDQSQESMKRYGVEQARLERYAADFAAQHAGQDLQAQVQHLETQLAAHTKLVDALQSGVVGNVNGYSGYLRAFSRQVLPGLWLTGFKINGDGAQISLSGGVLNPELLPHYIQRLSKESVMQGKSFATLQMQQPGQGEGNVATRSGDVARYVEFTLSSIPDEVKK